MKYKLLIIFSFVNFILLNAQFQVGQRTLTFNDPSRTGGFGSGGGAGRQIQCEIYYPATSTGLNANFATDSFPVIVFGHGFSMAWSAYQNIWEALVPQGYIMVFPRTEGSLSPSHNDFAIDLRICVSRMQLENSTATSAFYQHVLAKTAIMGHSMGGGSTVLAASGQTNIQTIVCLAPAETNPSAITAASGVNVPAIVFSGNGDAVTPPANHHTPIYNALSSSCKSFLSILGGGHCYFANSNFNCDFGETTSGSTINLTRAQQQDITQDISSLWLSFHLKSDCSSWQSYLDSLGNSTRFTEIHQCGIQSLTLTATVSDASGGNNNGSIDLSVNGGSNSYNYQWSNGEYTQDISNLSPGTYIVVVTDANGCSKTDTFLVNSTSSIHAANFEMYLSVFPNPSNNELKIKSSIWCKSFRLIDMQGKIVMEREIQRNLNEMISVQILPRGIYYLDIEWGDSSKSRKKIILQ